MELLRIYHHNKKKRELYPRTPDLIGMGLVIVGKVNEDHACDAIVLKSRTVFMVCLNSVPVYWHSKSRMLLKLQCLAVSMFL